MRIHETVRAQRRGDRGIAAVFFAISVTAMLAVGALVLGGSVGYTASRNAQTAADSAALAGASAIREHKHNWVATSAQDVFDEVESVVESNGATLASDGCEVVNAQYALTGAEADVLGTCEGLASLEEEDFAQVAGVRVTVDDTRDVPFAAFVDQETITGRAVAAATVQSVSQGRAPFMICTAPTAIGHPAQALLADASDPTGYVINEDAIGEEFVLHGTQVKYKGRDCENPSSSWRGLVRFGESFPVPSPDPIVDTEWFRVETGNTNGNLPNSLAGSGACELNGQRVDDLQVHCRIAVPLCPKGNGNSSDFRLYCVKIAAFEISRVAGTILATDDAVTDNPCGTQTRNIICGKFIGAATAVGGQGWAAVPDPHGLSVVKLVE